LAVGVGAAFAAVGLTIALATYLVFVALLIQLSVIDLAEHRLPNQLTLRAFLLASILLPVAALAPLEGTALGRAVLGAVASFAFHLLIHIVSPRGFGLGDVKLSPTIGAHLAFLSADALMRGILVSFVLNAVVVLGLMTAGRADRHTKVAFGPFMAAGAFVALYLHGAFA